MVVGVTVTILMTAKCASSNLSGASIDLLAKYRDPAKTLS